MNLIVLAVNSFIGLVLSAILSQHFYEVRSGTSAFQSFCNMGDTMNCDVVAASRFAELVPGIPLSSFAAGWFLALTLLALIGRGAFWRREVSRAVTAMYAFATALSLFYFGVMAFQLHTYCLFCLLVDAVNVVGLVTALSLKPEGLKGKPLEKAKWKTILGIAAGSLAIMVFTLHLMVSEGIPKEVLDDAVQSTLTSPALPARADAGLPSIGAGPDAPITIVEFSDYQCPHCKKGAMILNSVIAAFPGKVRVVARSFPLDPSCNRSVQHSGHPVACEAARAALCAQKQGKFQRVYEELFERQSAIAPGLPAQIAKEAGVNETDFAACMASTETAAHVVADIDEGIQLGVKSTPTFFINGHKVEGAYPVVAWQKIIEALLKK